MTDNTIEEMNRLINQTSWQQISYGWLQVEQQKRLQKGYISVADNLLYSNYKNEWNSEALYANAHKATAWQSTATGHACMLAVVPADKAQAVVGWMNEKHPAIKAKISYTRSMDAQIDIGDMAAFRAAYPEANILVDGVKPARRAAR